MAQEGAFVPTIQLGAARSADHPSAPEVAAAIARACQTSGFFVLTDHGVSRELVEGVYEATRAFFTLPLVDREAVAYARDDPLSRGFKPGQTTPHLLETFSVNRLGEPDQQARIPEKFERTMRRTNRWPSIPGFREAYGLYYEQLEKLAMDLMRLCASALKLPSDWFDDKFDQHLASLTANHYPPLPYAVDPKRVRQGMHRDWGTLTILYQDDAPGGLQVLDDQRSWHDVPAVPESFVVNIGTLFSIWTNTKWQGSIHRVVAPPAGQVHRERYSIAFFHHPNFDTQIECIPTCCDADDPALYSPLNSGRYLLGMWNAAHQGSAANQPGSSL